MSKTNKIIHEQLMGECWHTSVPSGRLHDGCSKCDKWKLITGVFDNPDYCDDLNLAFIAQVKAIERFGEIPYCRVLIQMIINPEAWVNWWNTNKIFSIHLPILLTATAEQRCEAIVKLLEGERN